jgi:hypothetical protein
MKKIILFLFVTMFSTAAFADQPHDYSQLPQNAQKFAETYFKEVAVSAVTIDKDFGETTYNIRFGRIDVEFDRKGQWLNIDNAPISIYKEILPKQIFDYIQEKHPNIEIKEVERTFLGYNVELKNDMELLFNKEGKFRKYDL